MTINSINGSSYNAGMMKPPQLQNFTEDQKAQVASILADYDPTALTTEDAQSINAAFKEAGFKEGFGLYQAISEAGFDGDTIRDLDPPPHQSKEAMGPPPPRGGGSLGLNKTALAELQSILEQYDLDDLSAEEENELLTNLNESGYLIPGFVIDTSI